MCIPLKRGQHLLVLADGMGGEVGGDIASDVAVASFCAAYESPRSPQQPRDRLLASLESANQALSRRIMAEPDIAGMGTTLIGAVVDGGKLRWISVGDSPMWLFRDAGVKRLNANHSVAGWLAQQVEDGQLSSEDASKVPDRSHLLEAVMGDEIEMIDAPPDPVDMLPGDVLVLATDGVESCSESELAGIVASSEDCSVAVLVDRVLDAVEAHERPGQDNATLIAFRLPANLVDE